MHAEASTMHAALLGLAFIGVLALLTWLASLVQHDVSLVDRVWSVFIVGAGIVYYFLLPQLSVRGGLMVALGTVWALRLCAYVSWRNWGHGEDRRYQEIRARNEPGFPLKSLYLIFVLQAVLAWLVSMPFLAGIVGTRALGLVDALGVAVCCVGLVFEVVGDAQMARFKADPANRGQVMDRGLWRYTRHPNYFGETCFWWGLWLMAVAGAGWVGVWTIVSPLVMTVLLLKVSGVTLLEKDIGERRPAYRDYIVRTNAFFPGPPRRSGL